MWHREPDEDRCARYAAALLNCRQPPEHRKLAG
jgi:hypothetical protein